MRPDAGLSCFLIGSESLLVQCGEILRQRGHEIRGVVSDAGPILRWANEAGIPTIAPKADLVAALGSDFDFLFSITNLSVLPEEVLRLPRRLAINFHDGPLPRYAGLYAPVWALLNGERQYGITWHVMKPGLDEGEILQQRLFELGPGETSLTINTRCYEAGLESFAELVDALAQDRAQPFAQDLSQRSYFGKFERPASAGVLCFARPAAELDALVRALDFGRYENPFAAAKLVHAGQAVLVGASASAARHAGVMPGGVVALEADAIVVESGDGALRLSAFATPRGKRLSAAEAAARLGLLAGGRVQEPDAAVLAELATGFVRAEDFWRRRLARLEPIALPQLRAEAPARATEPAREQAVELPAAFAGREDALLGALAIFLARLSGRGTFDLAYRDRATRASARGREALVSDVVPLRVALDLAQDAAAAHAALERELAAIRKRGAFLHDLVARTPQLRARADLVEGLLAPVLFELHAEDGEPLPLGVALAFAVDARGLRLRYDRTRLDESRAAALVEELGAFLASLASATSQPLSALSVLSPRERELVLRTWNATEGPAHAGRTVHELIAAQVARTPDAPALTFEDRTLSYRELHERASRLADELRALGIGPDRLVGIFIERSAEMLISVLGVLQAGGAYVPLDPAYPRDRIAFMIEDSRASVILTQESLRGEVPETRARVVSIDAERAAPTPAGDPAARAQAEPQHLAYVIYTSGSTGKPKGVMVEHRNVANFFAAMDAQIPAEPPRVWMAVTSLSFDISVLELLWTLTRGFEVVIHSERERGPALGRPAARGRALDFGLFLWGSDDAPGPAKYRLMLESARFADRRGFAFVSTPERHFHAFGGPYPNPSVTSAAIAAATERVQIRAGSCVLPLHHPIRVAEEWAVVDNLSNGRVAISFAAGWQPNDFVIRPESYADAKKTMLRDIETVRRLWRGEAVEFQNPMGEAVATRTLPRPIQPELPIWITTAGNVETYRQAGAAGANLLTHLLGQSLEEVAEKVRAYRAARAGAGLDPATGKVTLMLHTFVGENDDDVREIVREPMKQYLASSVNLIKGFAWAFPAFKRPADGKPEDVDLTSLSDEEMNAILEHAFERYFETSGLFGSLDTCEKTLERVRLADVDEVACLIDYGVPTDLVLASLERLDQVRARAQAAPVEVAHGALDQSLAAQIERRGATHLQCTPSLAKMMLQNDEMRAALRRVQHLYIGGEAFPPTLARELVELVRGDVTNMYGPTETTIWSTTQPVTAPGESIPIGRPIANTEVYVLDEQHQPVPPGVPGELYIGGLGVVRGYHQRAELTAERFVPDPFAQRSGARLYRTGDLARWRDDGVLEFLGRIDHQVKLRGYRIELGEIEAELARHPRIQAAVVVAREDSPGDTRLVAYFIAKGGAPGADELREQLSETLPAFMVPSHFVALDAFPLTPNGKIDRKALPAPEGKAQIVRAHFVAPTSALETTIAQAWREVLRIDEIGADDNFFDLGGHSLLVVQVHRRLREQIATPLSLTDLYRFPTIRSLAEHLTSSGGDERLAKSRDRGAARRDALRQRAQARPPRGPGEGEGR